MNNRKEEPTPESNKIVELLQKLASLLACPRYSQRRLGNLLMSGAKCSKIYMSNEIQSACLIVVGCSVKAQQYGVLIAEPCHYGSKSYFELLTGGCLLTLPLSPLLQ